MQRTQAGHATEAPIAMRTAERIRFLRDKNQMEKCVNVQISHHTGAQLTVFPLHIMESTQCTRQVSAVQIMNTHVPTFRASRCQVRGMSEMMNPIPENTVNTVLEAVILARCVS